MRTLTELAAQAFHFDRLHDRSLCWCCCDNCDPDFDGDNPHFVAAQGELRARIVREALLPTAGVTAALPQ